MILQIKYVLIRSSTSVLGGKRSQTASAKSPQCGEATNTRENVTITVILQWIIFLLLNPGSDQYIQIFSNHVSVHTVSVSFGYENSWSPGVTQGHDAECEMQSVEIMCTHVYLHLSICLTNNNLNCVSQSQTRVHYSCLHTKFTFQISYVSLAAMLGLQ